MPDEQELARERDQASITALLQDVVLDSEGVQEYLTRMVEVAADAFAGRRDEVFCGVTLLRPRSMITVASSSELAQRMDEVQYGFDDGPCLRAAREGYLVHIEDFLTEERFPEYRQAITQYGVRSALGVPIPLEAGASAGLDFYSTQPGAFDPAQILAAERIAREASASLRLAVRMSKLTEDTAHLRTAMESRTTIDLAVGVIMGQNRCDQDAAFKILKAASSSRNIKIRVLSADILTSVGQGKPVSTAFHS